MQRHYTGVGSRSTPPKILKLMTEIARQLGIMGYILRSGGAPAADLAFEKGSGGVYKQIYRAHHSTPQAEAMAEKYHPNWNACKTYVRKLHGRNAFQVLGSNLNEPSVFLICWTPDGCINHKNRCYATGGTGTAISIANDNGISIYNLQRKDHFEMWSKWTTPTPA